MVKLPVFECDGCGACCQTYPIFAAERDVLREPRVAVEGKRLAEHLGSTSWTYQLFPLPFHQTCCFLDGEKRCEVYTTRPQVCRDFAAGSGQCQEARRRVGLLPLATAK